jgi:hypothetical protein
MAKRKHRQITVVVATRDREALKALEEAAGSLALERREALSTEGLYRALKGAHLVMADLETLVESPGMPRERLAETLAAGLATAVDGPTFAADPQTYLDQARSASGLNEALPARAAAFTGLAGGVGKTTLALSLARTFRRRTGLPAAVIELSFGPSGLTALAGVEWPHLYEVVTQGAEFPQWDGLTIAPMDWSTARMLDEQRVQTAWQALRDRCILTVFDGLACHPLWPLAARLADAAFAVSDARPDALSAAVYLAQGDENKRTRVLLNRGGLAARLTLEQPPAANLPDVGRAASRFPDRLGRPLIRLVYPGWK